ncbi:hypothetical protein Gohar_008656 [Gossypium harknessii]|uniref:RNase H type-1 domain-containing protein n=1 Tax=Gossypium harknessii TaxID=34285 RepID=A0A7J9GKB9_9ROSI|nr:hypothetical protein [Gossypium harknessii]
MRLSGRGVIWSCLFGLIAWRIWKNRNLFIFQGITWTAHEIVKDSFSWAQQYELSLYGDQCTSHFLVLMQLWKERGCIYSLMVQWQEIMGMLRLVMVFSKGIRMAIIQTDNLEVVRVLQDNAMVDLGITMLRKVQQIMRAKGQWRIRYIPNECNLVVDYLAKLSFA